MSIRIAHVHSQLTLVFDWLSSRFSGEQLEILRQKLSSVEGVTSVRMQTAWYGRRQLTVVFASEMEPTAVLRKMASTLRALNGPALSNESIETAVEANPEAARPLPVSTPTVCAADATPIALPFVTLSLVSPTLDESSNRRDFWCHVREFSYGILAVGSFCMSWVGLLVPGIPTVPFVILTAHFALQASPALRHRLLNSRMFGPMMRDWHDYRAIRRRVKLQAYVFTMIIMAIGFAVAPQIPALYALMVLMGAFGLFLISRIPVIESADDQNSVSLPTQNFSAVTAVV